MPALGEALFDRLSWDGTCLLFEGCLKRFLLYLAQLLELWKKKLKEMRQK